MLRSSLFLKLSERQQNQALAIYPDAHADDALRYEINDHGEVVSRFVPARVEQDSLMAPHSHCPQCHSKLMLAPDGRVYQTVTEHIGRPDREPSRTPYLKCPEQHCWVNERHFWDLSGNLYRKYADSP